MIWTAKNLDLLFVKLPGEEFVAGVSTDSRLQYMWNDVQPNQQAGMRAATVGETEFLADKVAIEELKIGSGFCLDEVFLLPPMNEGGMKVILRSILYERYAMRKSQEHDRSQTSGYTVEKRVLWWLAIFVFAALTFAGCSSLPDVSPFVTASSQLRGAVVSSGQTVVAELKLADAVPDDLAEKLQTDWTVRNQAFDGIVNYERMEWNYRG